VVQLIASRYRERIIAKEKAGGGVGEGGTGIGGTGRSILRCAAATPPWCEGVVGGPDATSACACGEVIPELSDAFAAVECLAPLSCYAVFRCERGCVYATHVRCFEDWCLAGRALGSGGADWDEPRRILEAMSKSEPDARVPPEHVVDAVVAAACYFNSVNVSSNDSNSNAADAATKKATCLTPGCGGTLTSGERVEKGVAAKDLLVAPLELDAAERDRRERVGDALSASDGGENGGVSSPGGPPSSAIEPAPELTDEEFLALAAKRAAEEAEAEAKREAEAEEKRRRLAAAKAKATAAAKAAKEKLRAERKAIQREQQELKAMKERAKRERAELEAQRKAESEAALLAAAEAFSEQEEEEKRAAAARKEKQKAKKERRKLEKRNAVASASAAAAATDGGVSAEPAPAAPAETSPPTSPGSAARARDARDPASPGGRVERMGGGNANARGRRSLIERLRAARRVYVTGLPAVDAAQALMAFFYDQARSIHWSPYDRVGVVNADP